MSGHDVAWLRPASPDGPTPLQTLLEWFSQNAVVFHASAHQREVLGPLCRELNARGVACDVDQILDYIRYLRELVHDASALGQALPEHLTPFSDQLRALLFKDGVLGASQKARQKPSSRMSWLTAAPSGGPSAMEVLVEWLKRNYTAYAHASRKGEKGRLLERLVQVMKDAGHHDCAVNTVRSKIDTLQRDVREDKHRSAAYEQFGSVLEEIFTMGDAGDGQDEDMSTDDDGEGREKEDLFARGQLLLQHGSDLPSRILTNPREFKVAPKATRSSPVSRLAWMKPSSPSGVSAMELLVEWLEQHYHSYTHSTKKGDKGKMLNKLLREIQEAGHQGCTIHAIRVKIDSLQRQAAGKSRPSAAFEQYGPALRNVFEAKNSFIRPAPRTRSPNPSVARRQQGEEDDSHVSEEEEGGDDENPGELVQASVESSVSQSSEGGNLAMEQPALNGVETRGDGDIVMQEAYDSADQASSSSGSETEEDEEKPILAKAMTTPPMRHEASSPAEREEQKRPTMALSLPREVLPPIRSVQEDQPAKLEIKIQDTPILQVSRGDVPSPATLEELHGPPEASPPQQFRPEPSSPARSPSTSEIVRIATLLRERHDLLQRGVPQEQIDKFLPLPDA